jgi:hypothetical protein
MNAIILFPAVAVLVSFGFLVLFVILLIGMRTEASHLSPSSASHTGTQGLARRILGLYVRREPEKTPAQQCVRR